MNRGGMVHKVWGSTPSAQQSRVADLAHTTSAETRPPNVSKEVRPTDCNRGFLLNIAHSRGLGIRHDARSCVWLKHSTHIHGIL
eukprot:315455-Amphidinium_carterae.1